MALLSRIGLVSLVVGCLAPLALAQQGPGGGFGGGQGGGPGGGPGGGFGPGRMMANLQQQLAMSDDEFAAIQPKVQQIMQLSRDASARPMGGGPGGPGGPGGGQGFGGPGGGPQGQGGGPQDNGPQGGPGGGGFGGGPGGPGGPGGFGQGQTPSDVQKALNDLRQTLSNPDAAATEISAKMDAVRTARAKAKDDLAKAREDLKSLLTARQEAVMLSMGMLE